MSKSPKPIHAAAIPKAVAQAVKAASEQAGHALVGSAAPESWHIVGRVMKDDAAAQAFGTHVVETLDRSGIKGTLASAKIGGGHIIMGFFPVDPVAFERVE